VAKQTISLSLGYSSIVFANGTRLKVPIERLGRVTGWVEASGQTSAIGGQAIWQVAT
jgi:hypothetical protein